MANLITAVASVPLEASPFAVGGGILCVLFLLLAAVLAFGGGREHS